MRSLSWAPCKLRNSRYAVAIGTLEDDLFKLLSKVELFWDNSKLWVDEGLGKVNHEFADVGIGFFGCLVLRNWDTNGYSDSLKTTCHEM